MRKVPDTEDVNQKGYPTNYCCSGHVEKSEQTYVVVQGEIESNVPLDGFTVKVKDWRTMIDSIP